VAISAKQFTRLLQHRPLDDVVVQTLFAGTPFIFRTNNQTYASFRNALSDGLRVPTADISVVGSAALGFSMDPANFGRKFDETVSDVDVIVVSEGLFEQAWSDLLAWNHSRKWSMSRARVDLILSHHKHAIYWGHVWPDILAKISIVTASWRQSFRGLSRDPQLAPFNYQGRLYKSWNHARYYHVNSLRTVVGRLRSQNII
jgi:hypothetical protein